MKCVFGSTRDPFECLTKQDSDKDSIPDDPMWSVHIPARYGRESCGQVRKIGEQERGTYAINCDPNASEILSL
jgi:hypothetical protein